MSVDEGGSEKKDGHLGVVSSLLRLVVVLAKQTETERRYHGYTYCGCSRRHEKQLECNCNGKMRGLLTPVVGSSNLIRRNNKNHGAAC